MKLKKEERPFLLTGKMFLRIIDKSNLMCWNATYLGHLAIQLGQAPIIVRGTNYHVLLLVPHNGGAKISHLFSETCNWCKTFSSIFVAYCLHLVHLFTVTTPPLNKGPFHLIASSPPWKGSR
ncbi:hypothetical protein NC653_038451 [Populus alba x Populus x berolinensis]|uniref:Uncharacterized protein n=1 Tax=Populus alba x Populus x berolinensis TaxID=444605 RepID=A0AAD6LGZ1_9ROSI|nr:hypothetical protein NC653_038451 [Populus alba x Populus x berolinensis]